MGICKSTGRGPRFKDLTGQVFFRLWVLGIDDDRTLKHVQWICMCDCGKFISLMTSRLTCEVNRSCGCYRKEVATRESTTHGLYFTPEYSVFQGMITRTENPKDRYYKDYGERGIKVHQAWKDDFSLFFNHVGPRPTSKHEIDRINNDGNYEPGNVRWSTRKEQMNNTRHNVLLEHNGRIKSIQAWADEAGIDAEVFRMRIKSYHWSTERALTEKPKVGRRPVNWEPRLHMNAADPPYQAKIQDD